MRIPLIPSPCGPSRCANVRFDRGPGARSVFGRRTLLRRAAATAGAGALAHGVSLAGALVPASVARAAGGPRFLVLLRLYGGNDGLNTVIPFEDGRYYDARPALAVTSGHLPISADTAFLPEMTALKSHFDAGRLAVIQGVGYAPPSLSHFRSEAIWQSARPDVIEPTGWIGRYLDTLSAPGDTTVRGLDVAYSLDQVFVARHANVFALPGVGPDSVDFPTDPWHHEDLPAKRAAFEAISLEPRTPGSVAEALGTAGYVLSRNVDVFRAIPDATTAFFPPTDLGRTLRETAKTIAAARAAQTSVGVIQVGVSGFDTHSEQDMPGGHRDLWKEIDGALGAFHQELVFQGADQDVLVVVYSEFGRRVEENGSRGTDHGTSAPMFAFGTPVRGGLYGPPPDLGALDADGNLVAAIDFRSVYREVLDRWLGADPDEVLGAAVPELPFRVV